MLMNLSQDDKDLMHEQGYAYGVCVHIPVYPDFLISLACTGENKNWADWDMRVYKGLKKEEEITFEVFPEPQFRMNQEVLATSDNIMRAIKTCKLLHESEEQMDISWILTQYQWGDVSDCWYTVKATAFTTLKSALLGLGLALAAEYNENHDPIEWYDEMRFVNDTDECPSSRATRMWNLTKITKEGR